MTTKLVNNALLVFNLNIFFFTTSTFANLIPNSQLSSQDILHHIQQQQQLQQSQQQYQQQLYSPQIHHIDNHKTNINNHFANNHVEKEDLSSKLLTPSSSSSQSLPSTFSSPSSSSLSSSILTSIVNGQLPLDEQDTLKLLQHLKSSSLEDFHQLQSLPSTTSTINQPTTSATTTTTSTTATPSIHAQTLQSLSSSPTSSSLTPSSSSFNSFIASIFPTLWAANNNFNTPLNYPSHKTDENLKTKMLPPIYIQPIVIPYPMIMNPIQNVISDYTSRFMSGYSSDSTLPPASATTAQQSSISSFIDEYDVDQMARSNTRRSGINSYSNSPIYYVRIPSPTPYTFIPTISYTTNPVQSTTTTSHPTHSTFNSNPYHNPFTIQINHPQPIQTFATLSSPPLSPILNLPISFISNGKPNGIYQLTTSDSSNTVLSPSSSLGNVNGNNGLQLTYHQNHHPQRIPSHHYSQTGTSSSPNPFYRPSIIRPHSSYQHLNNGYDGSSNGVSDSKITNLKRQYFFNGRPEEIYLLSQSSPASNQYQFQNSIYPTFQNAQNDYY